MKRLYRRYFVLLDTEDYGYGLGEGNSPKGYAKIEIKNDKAVFSLHCQNMKKLDEKQERYRIYLLKVNDIKTPINIELGPMEVDERGTSEAIFEFNAENVKASKISIDDFDAIAIVVEKTQNKGDVVAPLIGYVYKEKVNWKSAFSRSTIKESESLFDAKDQSKEVAPLMFEKKPIKEDVKDSAHNENTTQTVEPEKVTIPEKSEEQDNSTDKEEILLKPTSPYSFEEDSEDIIKYPNDTRIQEQHSINTHNQPQINHIQYYIESTLKLYPRVNPFESNLEGYEWWQIYHNQQTIYRAYMPFIAYLEMMNNPHQYHYPHYYPSDYYRLIYMYQHYLFGICYDENKKAKYFVYAIPGRKIKEEQPFAGRTGFIHWKSCMEKNEDSIGYWLLHIDPVTGLVVEPLAKTEI